jgi:hypothetical protein
LPLAGICADPAEIDRCRTIVDPAQRLACFDRASTAPAAPTPAVVVPAAPAAAAPAAARVEDFGKPPPPAPAEVTRISAGVREFARTARGRAVFVLDNGQTWRQIDGDTSVVHEPAPGEPLKVVIERGLLDSYNLMIDGRNGMVKVRRLQ